MASVDARILTSAACISVRAWTFVAVTGLDRPSTNEDPAAALAFDFAQTARVLFAAGGLEET